MVNSIQEKQSEFSFNYWYTMKLNLTYYFESLWYVANKFTDIFSLWNMKITQKEFWTLLKETKGVKRVGFNSWMILTDWEWEFGEMKEWKIQTLDLNNTGNKENSNWIENEKRLENILGGIDKSEGLLKSMVALSIRIQDYERGIKKLLRSINSKFPKLRNIKMKY